MLSQFEDMILNTLVEKLNSHGLNLNAETVKKAVANSPQIVQQIEEILLTSNSQEKLAKITALITQAAKGTTTTTTTTSK